MSNTVTNFSCLPYTLVNIIKKITDNLMSFPQLNVDKSGRVVIALALPPAIPIRPLKTVLRPHGKERKADCCRRLSIPQIECRQGIQRRILSLVLWVALCLVLFLYPSWTLAVFARAMLPNIPIRPLRTVLRLHGKEKKADCCCLFSIPQIECRQGIQWRILSLTL